MVTALGSPHERIEEMAIDKPTKNLEPGWLYLEK